MKLIEPHPAGRALHLTVEARALLKRFDELDRKISDLVLKTGQEMG
jgi:hypothetical protein